jgi:hypothetical protein
VARNVHQGPVRTFASVDEYLEPLEERDGALSVEEPGKAVRLQNIRATNRSALGARG